MAPNSRSESLGALMARRPFGVIRLIERSFIDIVYHRFFPMYLAAGPHNRRFFYACYVCWSGPIQENDFSNASMSAVRQAVHLSETLIGFG